LENLTFLINVVIINIFVNGKMWIGGNMNQYWRYPFLLFILIFVVGGCRTESTSNTPVGTLVSQTGCKTVTPGSSLKNTASAMETQNNQECIAYQYDDNTLQLRHINAGFNCCPGRIIGGITIKDFTITIIEAETSTEKCDCLCLYDLDYTIRNLEPGIYTINFSGSVMEFTATLQLGAPGADTICIERTRYPWI
jgi:hypothetical protein